MDAPFTPPDVPPGFRPGTLGAVLYSAPGGRLAREAEWVSLVNRMAAGEQPALHELYQRARRPVFTLAVRITGSRETAEEVTLDVFHEAWQRAGAYDPRNGTVLGWIMNVARSRAIDRVRREGSQKRQLPDDAEWDGSAEPDPRELLELKELGDAVQAALVVLTPEEREAVQFAFLAGFTHSEVAARLGQPLGTVKTRIRSALQKLKRELDTTRGPS